MILHLFFILGIIIGVLIGTGFFKEYLYENTFLEKFVAGLFATIVGFFTLVITMLIAIVIISTISATLPNIEYKEYVNIVFLNNQQNIEGSFLLGSGTIKEVEYYFYFIKREDSGYKRDKIEVSKVIIYETDEESPKMSWTKVEPIQNEYTKFWLAPDISDFVYDYKDYRLIVPKNTIIREFQLK